VLVTTIMLQLFTTVIIKSFEAEEEQDVIARGGDCAGLHHLPADPQGRYFQPRSQAQKGNYLHSGAAGMQGPRP
jgi:hypothetical protein